MADEIIKRDQNFVTVLAGVTDDSDLDVTMLRVDPITKRLLVKATGIATGVTSLNGLTGALTLAAGTGISIVSGGSTITISATTVSPLTTKGDLFTFTTVDARLPVGTNGQLLSADSSTATGLKWIAAPSTTLAAVSVASTTTPNSLYTMTSTIPVEFKTSGGTHLLYLNESSAYVSIGTNAPDSILTVSRQNTIVAPPTNTVAHFTGLDATPMRITLDTHDNTTSGGSAIIGRKSRGTAASPSAVLSGDTLVTYNGQGYGASQYPAASTGLISIKALENFTNSAMGTSVNIFTTPTGSVTAAQSAVFTSTGLTIGAATWTSGGTAIVFNVTQTAHGFSVGDVIKSSGSANAYAKAQADSAANAEVVGIVTIVTDANNFSFATQGVITTGVPAATAGTVYFLSPSSAGAITATEPSTVGQVSKPVLIVLESAAKAEFSFCYRGTLIASTPGLNGSVAITIDGQGGVITTGQKGGFVSIPYNGTITGWVLSSVNGTTGAALSGSIVVDTWADSYANFPPTVADSIWATKPTLSSASKNTATGLAIAVTSGTMIGFNVDSVTTCVLVTLTVFITKS